MNLPQLYDIFNEKWQRFQTCWMISDTHFDDADMRAYFHTPSGDEIVKKINSKVGKNDMLIILGDVGNLDCVKRLRGYKVLIAGNHDQGLSNFERKKKFYKLDCNKYSRDEALCYIAAKHPEDKLYISKHYDTQHAPFEYWYICADNLLFDEVYAGPLVVGPKLILSHEPIECSWAFNLCGHVHLKEYKGDRYHKPLCAEKLDFEPINLNQWLKHSGALANIDSIHRAAIDRANARRYDKVK